MPENISGVPAGRSVFHLTSPLIGLLNNFTLSGRNYALRDETASRPVYASLSSSVRYLGASAFTFSMNAA
jgi:hypothetical protein